MASSFCSSRTNPAVDVALPPSEKEALFNFLRDTQLSGRVFETVLKAYYHDAGRFVNLLEELRCNTPDLLPLWLLEFDMIRGQAPYEDQDTNIVSNNKCAPRPQPHLATSAPGHAYRATGKRFKQGSRHSRFCKKQRERCTLIWKGSSTCFSSHFRRKHLKHYQNKNGTYNCCGIQFEGSTAEDDILDHIWENDMEEVPLLSTSQNKPTCFLPLQLPTVTALSTPPSASGVLQIMLDPQMTLPYASENHLDFQTSGADYISNEKISSVGAHDDPPGDLPQDLDLISNSFPNSQTMPGYYWENM